MSEMIHQKYHQAMQVRASNWHLGNNRDNVPGSSTEIEGNYRKGSTNGKDRRICRWFQWFPISYSEGSLKYLLLF